MKRLPVLILCVVVSATLFSCNYGGRHSNLSVQFKEWDHYYSMDARFNKNKTKEVELYMDRKIGRRSNKSFRNSNIDGKISLDDETTFFIKKSPGILRIKLDKDENSEEAVMRMRSMCEGIKEVLVR